MLEKKTTIWRDSADGKTLISEKQGLPSPIPSMGQQVFIPNIGETICTGVSSTGTNGEITEIQLSVL